MTASAGFGQRIAWHARLAWRASRSGILAAAVGGALLHLVLPVRGAWLAAAVGGAAAIVAFGCIAMARHELPPPGLDAGPTLEKAGSADQVAHGLARAASVLLALWVGLWLGGLL